MEVQISNTLGNILAFGAAGLFLLIIIGGLLMLRRSYKDTFKD